MKDLYIDMNPPKLSLKGITNFAIVNTDVEILGQIEEENTVGEYVFEGIWKTADGKESLISTLKCNQEKNIPYQKSMSPLLYNPLSFYIGTSIQ